MNSLIKFSDTKNVNKEYYPKAAGKDIPKWYKNTESYIQGVKSPDTLTVKKCIPVFDSMSLGYLIYSPAKVVVSQVNGLPWYEWEDYDLISFHPNEQAKRHPDSNSFPYPKWNNGWSITTQEGYSCLFTTPMHHKIPFKIFDAVVDTDTFNIPVRFPFTLNDPNWEGIIEAGTPIAQVIPFKREDYEMNIVEYRQENIFIVEDQMCNLRSEDFNSYKNKFWEKKKYS
jgi:hypothetical protein